MYIRSFFQIHHPFAVSQNQTSSFQQPALVYHNNAWKTTSQLAIEAGVSQANKPLVEKFPVSAGLQHTQESEEVSGSDNVFEKYQVQWSCKFGNFLREVVGRPAVREARIVCLHFCSPLWFTFTKMCIMYCIIIFP